MKKLILILVCSLFLNQYKSQEKSVLLKQEFKPNSEYVMKMITSLNGEMEFVGDEDFIKAIKEKTGSDKMQMESKKDIQINIITSAQKNNETPFTWKYIINESKTLMNGNEIPSKNLEAFNNLQILGKYINGNEILIEDFKGNNIDISLQNMLKDMLKQVNTNVIFPKTAMKIGDDFTQATPLKMNIPSVGIVNFKINTTYKLINFENDLAYFDIIQSFSLDSDIKLFDMDASGSGNGKAIFDSKNNYMKSIISDIDMNLAVQLKESIKIINQSKTHSEISTIKNK